MQRSIHRSLTVTLTRLLSPLSVQVYAKKPWKSDCYSHKTLKPSVCADVCKEASMRVWLLLSLAQRGDPQVNNCLSGNQLLETTVTAQAPRPKLSLRDLKASADKVLQTEIAGFAQRAKDFINKKLDY